MHRLIYIVAGHTDHFVGIAMAQFKKCFVSGSVNGVHDEPSILDAFNQLRMKVYNRSVIIPGTNPGEVCLIFLLSSLTHCMLSKNFIR